MSKNDTNIDKVYCMSSYLAFRYIERDDKDFYPGLHHRNITPVPDEKRIFVKTAEDIDEAIRRQLTKLKGKKLGVMLSGGMDSAIVASYMRGCDAYTFRFLGGAFQADELKRAEYYAKYYQLKLHYVDISWETVTQHLTAIMREKAAPVHSIEPQIVQAALQAKVDGIDVMLIGDGADYVFGGMDGLLSKDWLFEQFISRYIFLNPQDVLQETRDMRYIFEKYRKGKYIDFLLFLEDISTLESYNSYFNAFRTAKMQYYDPYAILKMAEPLDLNRVRNGESKYLIRELFHKCYPEFPIPEKVPMPRPVDYYFKDWAGPTRPEFRNDLNMNDFTGNQKWQMWCLERFLNIYDPM